MSRFAVVVVVVRPSSSPVEFRFVGLSALQAEHLFWALERRRLVGFGTFELPFFGRLDEPVCLDFRLVAAVRLAPDHGSLGGMA